MHSTGLRGRKQSQKCKAELLKLEKIFPGVIVKVLMRFPELCSSPLRGQPEPRARCTAGFSTLSLLHYCTMNN